MQDAKRLSILEKHRKRRKILSPEDRIVFVWNTICAFAVIFVAIELPIRLSFPLNVDEKVYLIGEWVLTIFFSVDIAIVFVTAFEDEEGELFIDPFRVALRYARTWLIVDVIGTVPWDLLVPARYTMSSSTSAAEMTTNEYIVWVLQLPRLLRLLRLPRLMGQMRTAVRRGALGDGQLVARLRGYSSVISLVGYVIVFLLLAHVNGCLLMLFARLEGFHPDSWVVREGLMPCCRAMWVPIDYNTGKRTNTLAEVYMVLLYESIMVLLGDRGDPHRPWEHGWVIATILIGAYFYAQLLAAITTAMSDVQASEAEYRGKMDMTQQYLRYRKVPEELSKEVHRFMTMRYPGQRSFNEGDILEQLSPALHARIALHNAGGVLRALKVLHGKGGEQEAALNVAAKIPRTPHTILHERLQVSIALALTRRTRMCGEVLIEAGCTKPAGMFFLTRGEVGVIMKDGAEKAVLLTTIGVGSVFGESTMLNDQPPSATVIARQTPTEAFNMSREAFDSIVERFPRFRGYIQKVANARKTDQNRKAATNTFKPKTNANSGGGGGDGGALGANAAKPQTFRPQSLMQKVLALPPDPSSADPPSTSSGALAANPPVVSPPRPPPALPPLRPLPPLGKQKTVTNM